MIISEKLRHATKADPCPHCGKTDWCYSLGELTVCKRKAEPARGWHKTSRTDKQGDYFYAFDNRNPYLPPEPYSPRPSSPPASPQPSRVELARLPQTPDKLKRPIEIEYRSESKRRIIYPYSDHQQVRRIEQLVDGKPKKKTIPYHHNGQRWMNEKGDIPWNAYRIDEALSYGKGKWVLAVEGEKCVEAARDNQIVSITLSGSDWQLDKAMLVLLELKRHGVKGLIYSPDNDSEGIKKQQIFVEAGQKTDFPVVTIDPTELWSEMPEKGDIADWIEQLELTPDERVQKLEKAIKIQPPQQSDSHPELSKKDVQAVKVLMEYDRFKKVIGDQLRLNERSDEIELFHKDRGIKGELFELDYLELDLARYFGLGSSLRSKTKIEGIIRRIAEENAYEPVRDYLDQCAKQYNDTSILDNLAEVLFGTSKPIHQMMLKRTLIGAVARTYEPGCKCDTATVLYSPKQGIGKSTTWKTLFGEKYYCEDVGDISNKDEVTKMRTGLGCELSEISRITRKKDADKVKQFLSTSVDWMRPPYGRTLKKYKRRGIIIGTTNSDDFLKDRTGNRRFWIIGVSKNVDIQWLKEHRDQIWAAAVHLYNQNEKWWLTPEEEEQAKEINQGFMEALPFEDEILDVVSEKQNVTAKWIIEKLDVDASSPRNRREMERVIKQVLQQNGWEYGRFREGKVQKRGYKRCDTSQNSDVTESKCHTSSVTPETPINKESQDSVTLESPKNNSLQEQKTTDTPLSSEAIRTQILDNLRETLTLNKRVGHKQFSAQYPDHPDEVEAVLQRLESKKFITRRDGYIYHLDPYKFNSGNQVVILSGEFEGFHAEVEKYNKPTKEGSHTYIVLVDQGESKQPLIVDQRNLKLL